jgi:hypothetical protein
VKRTVHKKNKNEKINKPLRKGATKALSKNKLNPYSCANKKLIIYLKTSIDVKNNQFLSFFSALPYLIHSS